MKRKWRFPFLIVGLFLLTGAGNSIAANRMYFTDANHSGTAIAKVLRAGLDGANVEPLVSPPGLNPRFIALDVVGGNMYWTDIGTIRRANLDGAEQVIIVNSLLCPVGLALDVEDGKIYWTDCSTIQRADLNGANVEVLVSNLGSPRGIALDLSGGKMYWTDTSSRKIQRANLDGSDVQDLIASGLQFPQGIALDVAGGKMYWADDGRIQRANLNGTDVQSLIGQIVVDGFTGNPLGIALDVTAGSCTGQKRSAEEFSGRIWTEPSWKT